MKSTKSPPEEKEKKYPTFQPNLFAFFASNARNPPPKKKQKLGEDETSHPTTSKTDESETNEEEQKSTMMTLNPKGDTNTVTHPPSSTDHVGDAQEPNKNSKNDIPPPLIPTPTPTPHSITWQSLKNQHILIRRPAPMFFGGKTTGASTDTSPRTKVAAFDMDGTLFIWRYPGYPNQLSDYEVWNSTIFEKMKDLYRNQGYQLLIISNQGYIQKAHTGKTAERVQHLINWIAIQIDCPISAILSTYSPKKSNTSYHKPNPQLFHIAQTTLKAEWDIKESFFVGDSEDIHDGQGGVDRKFAQNVGLTFYTPEEYFGPSDASRRLAKLKIQGDGTSSVPLSAQQARAALLGGYWEIPILLILCGVQGSGKSTFAETLVKKGRGEDMTFVHLSQDILKQREKVEDATREGLRMKKTVIVDRMHLTRDQRSSFIQIGLEANVPVHVVVFNPPSGVITKRVVQRSNHPGNVQGEKGVQLALRSIPQFILPTYEEDKGITLISMASTETDVTHLVRLYTKQAQLDDDATPDLMHSYISLTEECQMPRVILGTMNVGKRVGSETIRLAAFHGFRGVDTAPTYKNEEVIGEGLDALESNFFCIVKIPRSLPPGSTVEKSFQTSLTKLKRSTIDVLLLHWPTEGVSEGGELIDVWKEMEEIYKQGKCKALGVCNFNVAALADLLPHVSIRPILNQVERHPFLPQWDLLDFCQKHHIHIQAHTPLGQGRNELLDNEVIVSIATESNQSPANVILQWNLQQGISVVPKCQSEIHMKDLYRHKRRRRLLLPDQMKRLDTLSCGKRFVAPHFMFGRASYCWGP